MEPSPTPFRKLPTLSTAGALARQLGSYAVAALLVALLARGALPPLRFAFTAADLGWGLAGIAAYVLYNAAFSTLLRRTERGRRLLGWMGQRNLTVFGKLPLPTLLLMAALAGAGEEIVFRGWLQPLAGLWLTSLIFALAHFLPNRYRWSHPGTWGMIAVYFPVGLLVGWLYQWRGNLLGPMVMHWLSDSLGLLMLARSAPAQKPTPASASPAP
jgi:membrane protease YdiL (CAAX protease family)